MTFTHKISPCVHTESLVDWLTRDIERLVHREDHDKARHTSLNQKQSLIHGSPSCVGGMSASVVSRWTAIRLVRLNVAGEEWSVFIANFDEAALTSMGPLYSPFLSLIYGRHGETPEVFPLFTCVQGATRWYSNTARKLGRKRFVLKKSFKQVMPALPLRIMAEIF